MVLRQHVFPPSPSSPLSSSSSYSSFSLSFNSAGAESPCAYVRKSMHCSYRQTEAYELYRAPLTVCVVHTSSRSSLWSCFSYTCTFGVAMVSLPSIAKFSGPIFLCLSLFFLEFAHCDSEVRVEDDEIECPGKEKLSKSREITVNDIYDLLK